MSSQHRRILYFISKADRHVQGHWYGCRVLPQPQKKGFIESNGDKKQFASLSIVKAKTARNKVQGQRFQTKKRGLWLLLGVSCPGWFWCKTQAGVRRARFSRCYFWWAARCHGAIRPPKATSYRAAVPRRTSKRKIANRGPFTLKHLCFCRKAKAIKSGTLGRFFFLFFFFLFLMLRWSLGKCPSCFRELRSFERRTQKIYNSLLLLNNCVKWENVFLLGAFPLQCNLARAYLVQVILCLFCQMSVFKEWWVSGPPLHVTPADRRPRWLPPALQEVAPRSSRKNLTAEGRILNTAERREIVFLSQNTRSLPLINMHRPGSDCPAVGSAVSLILQVAWLGLPQVWAKMPF